MPIVTGRVEGNRSRGRLLTRWIDLIESSTASSLHKAIHHALSSALALALENLVEIYPPKKVTTLSSDKRVGRRDVKRLTAKKTHI